MALQDFLDSEYLRLWKNDKKNVVYKKKVMLKDIRLSEDFHIYNNKVDNQASAYASSIWNKDESEISKFFFIHSRNIICKEDPENGGYILLSGVISYKTFLLIYNNQTEPTHRPKKTVKSRILKPLNIFVVPNNSRAELIDSCKESYTLKTWAKAEYIDATYAYQDEEKINEEYEKMKNNADYNTCVEVMQDGRRLVITDRPEVYFARIKYLRETNDEIMRVRVSVSNSNASSHMEELIY